MIRKEQFAEAYFILFPEKNRTEILHEYDDSGELLGHPFFGIEVALPLFELLQTGTNEEKIRKYCLLIEHMWRNGDDAVRNIVDVSILEVLEDDDCVWNAFCSCISQDFNDYLTGFNRI